MNESKVQERKYHKGILKETQMKKLHEMEDEPKNSRKKEMCQASVVF